MAPHVTLLDYLQQPGFRRLWPLVKAKYERYGRIAGTVVLEDLNDTERDALEGLLAANLRGQSRVSIPLKRLDQALCDTRFGTDLETALGALYPNLETRVEREAAEAALRQAFHAWAEAQAAGHAGLCEWLQRLGEGAGAAPGWRAYGEAMEEFRQFGDSPSLRSALRALHALPVSGLRLPVLAARETGDAHGLDRSQLAGRIFYAGLQALYGDGNGGGGSAFDDESEDHVATADVEVHVRVLSSLSETEKTRILYARAGIVLDDVSSNVLVAAWPGLSEAPVAVTLRALEVMTAIPVPGDRVYVSENPSIFSTLYDMCESISGRGKVPLLVCTSGQPSLAAIRLLDAAVAAGATLYYSGDFDVPGLQMAVALAERYKAKFVPWHMDSKSYQSVDHPNLPELSDVNPLSRLHVPWDADLVQVMAQRRRKVFQEHLLDALLADVYDWVKSRAVEGGR